MSNSYHGKESSGKHYAQNYQKSFESSYNRSSGGSSSGGNSYNHGGNGGKYGKSSYSGGNVVDRMLAEDRAYDRKNEQRLYSWLKSDGSNPPY